MGRGFSWVHRVLLAVMRGRSPDDVLRRAAPGDWTDLARTATHHGLQGLLADALRGSSSVPDDFQLDLQAAAVRLMAQRENHLRSAGAALDALTACDVLPVVLKGPAVAERYYPNPSARPYGDIDLLVSPLDLRRALAAFAAAGFEVGDRNWDLLVGDLRGQLHLLRANESTIELHWHVVNGARQRRTLGVTTEPLEERAVRWEIRGEPCRALPPEVEIPYLCLHAALHGSSYALWLVDIGMITKRHEVDWAEVVDLLEHWRVRKAGLMVLDLVRALVDPGLPDLPRPRAYGWERGVLARWDLGRVTDPAPLRKLLFATAGDDARTILRLAGDALVPPRTASRSRAADLRRVSWDTVRRVRRKLRVEDLSSPEFIPASGGATLETYLGEVEAYGLSRNV